MAKAGKRSSAATAAFPVMAVVPSKTDHQLKSLLEYGDNLEVISAKTVCTLTAVVL